MDIYSADMNACNMITVGAFHPRELRDHVTFHLRTTVGVETMTRLHAIRRCADERINS